MIPPHRLMLSMQVWNDTNNEYFLVKTSQICNKTLVSKLSEVLIPVILRSSVRMVL